jgi:hypothetical protein
MVYINLILKKIVNTLTTQIALFRSHDDTGYLEKSWTE